MKIEEIESDKNYSGSEIKLLFQELDQEIQYLQDREKENQKIYLEQGTNNKALLQELDSKNQQLHDMTEKYGIILNDKILLGNRNMELEKQIKDMSFKPATEIPKTRVYPMIISENILRMLDGFKSRKQVAMLEIREGRGFLVGFQ